MRIALTSIVVAGCALLPAEPASAACAAPPSIQQVIRAGGGLSDYYDTVFIGGPMSIEKRGSPSFVTMIRFRVEAVLRGRARSISSVVGQENVEDGFTFRRGHRYVVVAHTFADSRFKTNACVPTQAISMPRARRLTELALNPKLYPASAVWAGAPESPNPASSTPRRIIREPTTAASTSWWPWAVGGALVGIWITLAMRRRGMLGGRRRAGGPPRSSRR
jgi:hypothetical protein